jgi:hypothetical protein
MSYRGMGRQKRRAGFRKQRRARNWQPRGGANGDTNNRRRAITRHEARALKEATQEQGGFSSADIFEVFAEATGYGDVDPMRAMGLNREGRADGWHTDGRQWRPPRPRLTRQEKLARDLARVKRWQACNREKVREMARQYSKRRYREDAAFKERKMRAWADYGKAWKKANREHVNERQRELRRQPEAQAANRAKCREYYKRNRVAILGRMAAQRQAVAA